MFAAVAVFVAEGLVIKNWSLHADLVDLRDKAQRWLKRAQDLLAVSPSQQQQQQQQHLEPLAATNEAPAFAAAAAETGDGEFGLAAAVPGAATGGGETEGLIKALRPLLPCSANTVRLAALLLLESDSVCCCCELETRLEQLLLYALWRNRVARLRYPASDVEIAELLAAPQLQNCEPRVCCPLSMLQRSWCCCCLSTVACAVCICCYFSCLGLLRPGVF